jgi:hypothetical protein
MPLRLCLRDYPAPRRAHLMGKGVMVVMVVMGVMGVCAGYARSAGV